MRQQVRRITEDLLRSRLAQIVFGKPAAEHANDFLYPEPTCSFRVVWRVADHHCFIGLNPAYLLQRCLEDVGMGLRFLRVIG